jgi:hypothetical protein
MKNQFPKSNAWAIGRLSALIAAFVFGAIFLRTISAQETIEAPAPSSSSELQGQQQIDSEFGDSQAWDASPNCELRVFPAVLETRRFGPVEEPEPEFYALRNGNEPGFNWAPSGFGWGSGWGPFGFGWRGWRGFGFGWGFGAPFPRYAVGFAGYNRYFYRPWYASSSPQVWSSKFPWYSPGGVGPNIYQPWYQSRNALPWYSPLGAGPNIYTPSYSWQSYYPWYSPNGPGPNIYTPSWQYDGCFYW